MVYNCVDGPLEGTVEFRVDIINIVTGRLEETITLTMP